jgi:hypothetical protein
MKIEAELDFEISQETWIEHLESLGFLDEGWIDDRGKYWPCDEHFLHGYIAASVLGMPEDDAEKEADKRGWLRLSNYGDRTAARKLTKRQRDTLFDFCEFHGSDFRGVLNGIAYL